MVSLKRTAWCGLCVVCGWTAMAPATIRESQTFTNIASMDTQGDADNVKVNFALTGGYTMSTIHIRGVYTNPVTNTRPNQCRVRAHKPDGGFVSFALSDVSTAQTSGTSLVSARIAFNGLNPVGNWEFEFYESTDNAANQPDMVWQTITFDFEDNEGGPTGADVRLCQLYGLAQFSRLGDVAAFAVGTTSWNVGDHNLIWEETVGGVPDSRHPFIVSNIYRLRSDRFEQIGMSWVKHGFYALSNTQCGGFCNTTANGEYLGVGCTDTYTPSLNSQQSESGPRYEINAFTGKYTYSGSVFAGGYPQSFDNAVSRRNQVHDADINPSQNLGATYFMEGYYLCRDDSNVMNSAAWKSVTFSGAPGGTWSVGQSGTTTLPTAGWALDNWTGAQQVVLAQQVPVNEATSPDGRCTLASKVTSLTNGTWHYEYALLNVDMDRQVGSFAIDIPPYVNLTNIGFHAVEHHEESLNYPASLGGVAINNNAWTATVANGKITWSTTSNPLRWAMLYNFRFDADTGPTDGGVTLGFFRPGTPSQVLGTTRTPSALTALPCAFARGDVNTDGFINGLDVGPFVDCLLTGSSTSGSCGCADVAVDGTINSADSDALVNLLMAP